MCFHWLKFKNLNIVSLVLIQSIPLFAQVASRETGAITLNGLTHPIEKKTYVTTPVVRLEWMEDGSLIQI